MATVTEQVQYELSLKDLLTGKLKQADNEAKRLETTFGGLKSVIAGVGVAFGAIAIGDFLKESVAMFNDSAQASAQLDASMRSTANAANLNREALDAQAESLMNVSLFDDDAITGSQALLATFTNVKDSIYMDAIPAITDLATKMDGDLKGATIQVGKALNDPIKGITALTRVGVSFSDAQKKVITDLVNTGQTAKAQQLILAELNKEFGGSAAAAAAAGTGPLTVFQNKMGNIREELGGLVMGLIDDARPALDLFAEGFQRAVDILRDSIQWVKEHEDGVKAITGGLLVAAGALLTYELALKAAAAWQVISTTATAAWTTVNAIAIGFDLARAEGLGLVAAAQWALNAAMTANPIGLIIAGVAALAAGMIYAYEKSETFRGILMGLWGVVKEFATIVKEQFMGLYHVIHGAFTLNLDEIGKGLMTGVELYTKSGQRLAKAAVDGYNEGIADFKADQIGEASGSNDLGVKGDIKDQTKTEITNTDISPKKASGTKAVTINITIGKLIETFKVTSNNINEALPKVQTMVANTLVKAVNDSQLIADI